MNTLFVDIETTGLSSKENGILSICAKLYNGERKLVSLFKAKCFSDSKIDLGALKVNKFKLSEIILHKSEKEVLMNFCDWLLSLDIKGELVWSGHNPEFDRDFIKSKLASYNIIGLDQIASYRTIDTASTARILILAGLLKTEKASLKDVCLALNVPYDPSKAHDSEYDVDLTSSALFAMIDLLKGKISG